MKMNKEMKKSH